MTICEKVAYIKGLADGLELDAKSKEGKIIAAMLDVLSDIAENLKDVDEELNDIADVMTDMEESVADLEDIVYDIDEDDDYDDYEDDDDFDDEGFDFGDEDTTIYEVECVCGEIIDFDEETLEQGSMICPNCGETLEFSLEDDEDEE